MHDESKFSHFLALLNEPALAALRASENNLLAFSHGTDSTALFYALLAHKISFKAALINYQARAGADEEEQAAKELCERYGVGFSSIKAPKLSGNFEASARAFRYEYFAKLRPKNLITAHNLNDQFEWLLMQLARGAGAHELGAMNMIVQSQRFCLIRPLIRCSKDEIMRALKASGVRYFNDPSNEDLSFSRNLLRASFASEFVAKHAAGIAKSMDYLARDAALLAGELTPLANGYFARHYASEQTAIARLAKACGALLSAASRQEIYAQLSANNQAIANTSAGELAFARFRGALVCIKRRKCTLTKAQKELARKHKVPPFLRCELDEILKINHC